MTRKIFNSASSPSGMRPSSSLLTQYPRRFSVAGVRLHLPPPGRLWDPTLLERLHTPLTRQRD
jgi:hypothetical protein